MLPIITLVLCKPICYNRRASHTKEEFKMLKKMLISVIAAVQCFIVFAFGVSAAETHKVVSGDTMWKIAVKYQVGVSEIISANPQIVNPNLIYPDQIINIPTLDSNVSKFEKEVIKLVNEIRQENGLKALAEDWELSRVARYKSQDMKDNNYFSHTSPVYGSPFDMIKNFGLSYKRAGENIAKGQTSPQTVVNAWMNSSGHRANILNASYTKIGVGYVADGRYWTQMFIG